MFNPISKNPILWTDGYKLCHKDQYPAKTNWVYETWTPRMSRIDGISHVVFFGLQGALAEMTHAFDQYFFKQPLETVVAEYEEAIQHVFANTNANFAATHSSAHISALHQLGYLPIKVKAIREGSLVPVGVPMFTIENTHPDFFWLPGYLETQLSAYIWSPMTAATIADQYKRLLTNYAEKTGDIQKVQTQAGDFSMRGMGAPETAYRTAGGHLLSFSVSATLSVRNYLKCYYQAANDVLMYTPSTEHSVMCSYGEKEVEAFRHLITEVYPSGNISIVSDTYDLWNVVDQVIPQLKELILARDGKVVIRPDSGDPIHIICGDEDSDRETVRKGIVERLFEIFGGTVNSKGYKELDPHIGVVYGDSITVDRAEKICNGLMKKGFASTNTALGIGSYTYQYVTRDTFGFALKGTAEEVDGQFKAIQKRPATDTGNFKKSQKGMVAVIFEDHDYRLIDDLNPETIKALKDRDLLKDFYIDGEFLFTNTFDEIRNLLKLESNRVYGN
ncbi:MULTISPECIES: nicotinate phosphoribosyltransferase [unclassified Sphingobacterium]|uniref:nicotinate phosphoribosyltransferase n=1 Tax=unclassified Sphingobacterium TaxID=2609468 RepID=UPI0014391EDA|nr:nicotinate phosphoribosyltransferase [Sphingobacterium sp. B16(2022)]NJI72179.1 nicotinate phosphoribosyltransferase [Sphingobacterium sp. B16(2022)]